MAGRVSKPAPAGEIERALIVQWLNQQAVKAERQAKKLIKNSLFLTGGTKAVRASMLRDMANQIADNRHKHKD